MSQVLRNSSAAGCKVKWIKYGFSFAMQEWGYKMQSLLSLCLTSGRAASDGRDVKRQQREKLSFQQQSTKRHEVNLYSTDISMTVETNSLTD